LFQSRDITLKPDADNTDEGRKTMSENNLEKKEKTSDEVNLPSSQKIYVETYTAPR
jgi:hypothetical protein